ncbi:MAG: Uncharacterised protein [Cryomorphaceae bacterium]|nr:MAG: Uncharacterised protein [Cryomorphaceae bacterium]
MHQHPSSTGCRFCISGGLLEKLTANLLLTDRFFIEEFLQALNILNVKIGDARAFTTIASSSTGFLVVAFQRFRHVVVQYKTNVRFIDTHTKGNGGDNHITIFVEKGVLVFYTF